ncbi:MAG TPA: metallophosphoesterase [Balneolaceae bacterium]|nr:metallophosphoesterase [Balneolaceae bacterium]
MIPAAAYLVWRYYAALQQFYPASRWKRLILPFLFCSFFTFPISALVYSFFSGGIDLLEFPKALNYWFWFGLIFVYALATWVILADVIKLVSHHFSRRIRLIDSIYIQVLLLLFVATFCFTGWKTYTDTSKIHIQRTRLQIDDLPANLDGFRIVHISDIHGDEYTGRKKIGRYIQKVNQLKPDLIVFTGDLISYGTDYIRMSAQQLGEAKATYGVTAVVGDHDYWAGVENVKQALNQQGIPLIQDSNYSLKIDSTNEVLITGVTEVYSKKAAPGIVDSLTQQTGNSAFKIFASHQISDRLIEDAQKHNYDVMLAGHTHGGQIRIPFLGMTFSASDLETKYISGIYREGNIIINVNNGLGFTLAPIRYNAPPNISLIRLVAKGDS